MLLPSSTCDFVRFDPDAPSASCEYIPGMLVLEMNCWGFIIIINKKNSLKKNLSRKRNLCQEIKASTSTLILSFPILYDQLWT